MLIGQQHGFNILITHEERQKRLGGFNDLPPNITPATANHYWRLVAQERYDVERRQPLVDYTLWHPSRKLEKPKEGVPNTTLRDVLLYVRPDLSGILVVLEHHHALRGDAQPHGRYEPHFFKFAACLHRNLTSADTSSYSTLVETRCADCGFWTRVDSGD